jgi:hypothetical protein
MRQTDPLCSAATPLAPVRGDTGTGLTTTGDTGYAEAWYTVVVNETDKDNNEGGDVKARVFLDVPAGVDYNLFVYCPSCSDVTPISSMSGAGSDETVDVMNSDSNGDDDGYTLVIEIRFVSATMCGDWSLTVTGTGGTAMSDNIGDECEP